MSFTFNGTPSAEVTITGGTDINYENYVTVPIASATDTTKYTCPAGKKAVIISANLSNTSGSGRSFIAVYNSANVIQYYVVTTEDNDLARYYNFSGVNVPVVITAGDYVKVSTENAVLGQFTYKEFDA